MKGVNKIELEPNCVLYSLNYVFTPQARLDLEADIGRYSGPKGS